MNKIAKRTGMEHLYYVEVIHDRWIDMEGRQIWIHGVDANDVIEADCQEPGVEYMMATRTIKNLHILRATDPKAPVTIHLHTCGGDVVEGFAIYDAIKAMPYKTKMISYTHARSMSSIIFQAADERILLPSSYFLFHDGTAHVGGTVKSVNSYINFSNKHYDSLMIDVYADRLSQKGKFEGKTKSYIGKALREMMDQKEDVYLNAKEAIEWGFADKILKKFPSEQR